MLSPPHSSAQVKDCDGETMLGLIKPGEPHDLLNLLGRFAGASIPTGADQGRAHFRDFYPWASEPVLVPMRHCSRPLVL